MAHREGERWYAVCCRPRQETLAEANLLRQGFPVYLPRIRLRQRRRGQWVEAITALFPRYLFVRIDPDRRSTAPVRSTRGAVGLVRFGGQPLVVPEDAVDALRRREDAASGLHLDQQRQFRSGERVSFVEGPFAGMDGIFDQQDGAKRVIVLMELLGKSNRIRIQPDWLAKAA